MKEFTAIEYLAIDIANAYGLDKLEFEARIQWVKQHQDKLAELGADAEEPYLYAKAVSAFHKALKGLPIGHTVALDSVCSGLQLMSVLTGCKSGAALTGLVNPDKRTDAYTLICEHMNNQLDSPIAVPRKQAKDCVMTALYGSVNKPKEILGDGTPAYLAFHHTLSTEAKGAYWLLGVLKAAWNSMTTAHSWTLPDGYVAHVPVMVQKDTRVSISELNYTMSVQYYENEGTEKGISLPANVTHSVDAYVLRTLVRRCNYNAKKVKTLVSIIEAELLERGLGRISEEWEEDPVLDKYIYLWRKNQIVDVVLIDFLNQDNVYQVPDSLLRKLNETLSTMLEHEPFEVVTVHDSFASHPNHCNRLRYWYKEILAELAESNVLASILGQLLNDPQTTFTKDDPNLGNLIRKSNYGLC